MNPKIISVVTGASGFVGSHVVDRLLSEGHHVKCILRETSSKRWLEGKPVEIINSGLTDKENLRKVLSGADYLYHIAGVVKSKREDGYFKGNVETTSNLLDVLCEVNTNIKRVIIVSSLTACGPSYDNKICNEETIEHPITTYGRSKLTQEQLAKKYMDKLPITIIRPPAVYGPRDTEIYLVFKMYKMGLMTLIGFNKKVLSLVYIDDLVDGIYTASVSEKAINQTYFISAKEINDWKQVGGYIGEALGRKALYLRLPHFLVYTVAAVAQFLALFSSKAATMNLEKARDFVQESWTCDITKAEKELGFRQRVPTKEGIKKSIDWYRQMKWL
ncbi:MAG: NAD-dependent epimerase/dehydratase family protein [Bacteroidota bacterium]